MGHSTTTKQTQKDMQKTIYSTLATTYCSNAEPTTHNLYRDRELLHIAF